MAAPTCVLTTIKKFSYRANPAEEWSNRYMLTGATPADATAWRALFDAVVALEKQLFIPQISIIRGYGHDNVDPHADAVWSVDLRVSPNVIVGGVFSQAGVTVGQGDSAAWVRWGLNRMVKGKRVYLRKFFHPAIQQTGNPDNIDSGWKTAAQTYATAMSNGTLLGSRSVTDALGSSVLNTGISAYSTTRTLKRRGKKKSTTT